MDNLEFLRALDNESIGLIAIDPPFAVNDTLIGKPKPPITDAERVLERALAASHGAEALARYEMEDERLTRVDDGWSWAGMDLSWLAGASAGVRAVVDAVRLCATENEASYLAYMAERLVECHRVLKPTGSLYLHCDHHANSYLRMLMDAIFGHGNFRNEIAWCYTGPGSSRMRQFNRKHDTLLWYSKGKSWTFNRDDVRVPYKDGAPHGGQRWNDGEETLAQWRERKGAQGKVPETWWVMPIAPRFKSQYMGYATQKPVALYQRIVRASSNPGDVVLDPFAGSATTAMAAEKEGRQWLACDMAYRAMTMMMRRFYQSGRILSGMNVDVVREALPPHTGSLEYDQGLVIGPPDLARFPRSP